MPSAPQSPKASGALAALPIFVAVVDQGSFSGAARSLGISTSAVSKRINRLEEQLGVRLLHRTTRKLSLTEAGDRYYEHASAALAAAARAQDAVAELQGEPTGTLRINAPMSFGRLHVAPLIPQLLARYPRLEIDLSLDDRWVDLVAGGFDVAIRIGALPDSQLIARRLAPCRSALCAAPAYLERCGSPNAPDQLAAHNCILYSYASDADRWTMSSDGARQTVRVSGNYRVNNSEALLEAVREGVGIGRLPTFVAGPDLRSGRLRQVLPELELEELSIYAVFPERDYVPAKLRAFLDFASDSFGADAPHWDRQGGAR